MTTGGYSHGLTLFLRIFIFVPESENCLESLNTNYSNKRKAIFEKRIDVKGKGFNQATSFNGFC